MENLFIEDEERIELDLSDTTIVLDDMAGELAKFNTFGMYSEDNIKKLVAFSKDPNSRQRVSFLLFR